MAVNTTRTPWASYAITYSCFLTSCLQQDLRNNKKHFKLLGQSIQ